MAARSRYPTILAAGLVALAAGAGAHPRHGPAAPSGAGSANSLSSPAPADLGICAEGSKPGRARPSPTADASVADFARLLHGTWVRRLTIDGAPVETNSFWYFDMSRAETGLGQALMIDRVNQGWDRLAPPSAVPGKAPSGGEAEARTTTGGYWSVSIVAAPSDSASNGHGGVTMRLAGDYRGAGTGPNGFRFTESGTFYRAGSTYSTLHPWRAPPMAAEPSLPAAGDFTPVDAVVAQAGVADPADEPIAIGLGATRRPTLTFVVCEGRIVDRYHKIDGATPLIERRPLRGAWDSALASGMFEAEPAR